MPSCSLFHAGKAPMPESQKGVALALAAFSIWGLLPLYWKLLEGVPPFAQLCHRIVWSCVIALPVIVFSRRIGVLKHILRSPRLMIGLAGGSVLIGANWFLFIWAVSQHRVLDSSLGYYINPLMSTILGYLILKERFSRLQGIGIALAGLGVGWSIVGYGSLPVLSLAMALTFSLYSLVRKLTPADPICGVFMETAMITPLALAVLAAGFINGEATPQISTLGLLMLAGPFTLTPLLLFTLAAQRVRLTVLGLTQYVSPTFSFLLSIFVFGEKLGMNALITFVFIWIGLFVFSYGSWRLAHPPAVSRS